MCILFLYTQVCDISIPYVIKYFMFQMTIYKYWEEYITFSRFLKTFYIKGNVNPCKLNISFNNLANFSNCCGLNHPISPSDL